MTDHNKIKAILQHKAKDLVLYNQQREEELFKREDIQDFLKKNSLNRNFLHDNLSVFHRYVLSLYTPRPYALSYQDGFVLLEIAEKKLSKEEKEKKDIQQRILYSDLPEDYQTIHLEGVEQNENTKPLLFLISKVLKGEDEKGYYLYGDFGLGKTYLCAALMNEFARIGKTVAFAKVNNVVNEARRLAISDQEGLNDLLDRLKYCDVLFLDDIGNEGVSSFTRDDILFNILDFRMERKKLSFFTSNQDLLSLEHHYTFDKNQKEEKLKASRLLERIKTLSTPYCLKGENRRHK